MGTMYLVRKCLFPAQYMSPIGPSVTKISARIESGGIVTYAGMVNKKHTMLKASWKILWTFKLSKQKISETYISGIL
jgi:hypothetical protein